MKRLLCIVSCMNAGGAETFLMKLYRNLDRSKYQMDFCINSFEKGFYDDEIKKLGGKIFRIPSKSSSIFGFKHELEKIIKEKGYENVLRITSNAMGFWDLKIAKKAGAKVCIARSSNSSDGGSKKVVIAHKLGLMLFKKYVDIKIAPSDLAAKYTFGNEDFDNNKVKILHNAINLEDFKYDEPRREKIRKEFSIKSSTVLLGHIGRFNTQKNHSLLINIFKEYNKNNPDSVLLFVGTGELENRIKKEVEEKRLTNKVIFAGTRKDIPDILSAMDVFVFPSLYEGMPNTVIEAEATGLPCVISDSITKEADVTGIVKYISIEEDIAVWSETIEKQLKIPRESKTDELIKAGYDIKTEVKTFETLVF